MSPLDEVTLELNFYQDYQNGTINNQLGTRLATMGSTKTHKARVSIEYLKLINTTCHKRLIFLAAQLHSLVAQHIVSYNII